MTSLNEITGLAKTLTFECRKDILSGFKETDLHKYLKELFSRMEQNYVVEITHGANEFGKDLVLVRDDQFGKSAFGIVAKSGDIRGESAGRIDEIKSQVEQAFDHPATLKSMYEDLNISEVWIVLAGELSGNAQERLEKQIKYKNIRIFPIKWLVENFTIFYPQVFFEANVIDFLQVKIHDLESKHLFSKKGRTLSECFVEPLVALMDDPIDLNEEHLSVIVEKGRMPFLQLNSILKPGEKIILTGDPGVGKSMALSKLALDGFKKASELGARDTSVKHKIKTPILITAKSILSYPSGEELKKQYFGDPALLDRFEPSLLALDGLDEVSAEQRQDILEKASKLALELNCGLIITSRKVDIIRTLPANFKSYELLPFEFGRALKLFQKLITEGKVLDALREGLEKVKFQIPMVPLSLLLLIELAEEYKEIPASATELYQRFCDLMLGRWDKDKGIQVLFQYVYKEKFLAGLAFKEFFEKSRLEISRDEFNNFLQNYAKQYGWDETQIKDFVKELVERSCIISIREKVAFWHRSFLDYFIACYINDKREQIKNLNDFIANVYFDDIWSDIAFFYAGLRRELNDTILQKIFTTNKNDLATIFGKFSAARLLQAAWHSTSVIKYYGIENSINYAPVIRNKFLSIAEKSKKPIPRIFADYLVMTISSTPFSSGFLVKEIKEVFQNLSKNPSPDDNHIKMLLLLWSIQKLLDKDEKTAMINSVLESISTISDLEEQVRIYLFLRQIEERDGVTAKLVEKKLNRLFKKNPAIFKELLPPKRKGFKQKKKK